MVTIEAYASPDDLDPADLAAATAIFNAAWAEWVAGARPVSEDAFRLQDRFEHPPAVKRRHLARDEAGRVVGLGSIEWRDNEPEPGACLAHVMVDPAARQRGVGGALVRHLVDLAGTSGRIGLTLETAVDGTADRLCEKAGLQADLVIDLNQADTAFASDALLDEWLATGERAEGYSLVAYDGRCPDHLAEAFVAVRHVMNDAPRFEGEPASSFSVEELRAVEDACATAEQDWWAIGARHDATGDLVGLTDLFLPRARPWIGFQGDTGVADAHRGHRLGAWMKAVNHKRLRSERPEVEVVQTWNASANAPMLAINHALGYAPARQFRAWFVRFE